MRVVAALLCVLLSLPAEADEVRASSRGALSVVGVTLSGLGVGLLTFGLVNAIIAGDASALVASYGLPEPTESASVAILNRRVASSSTFALVGLIGGGVLVAGGIVALVLDRPAPPVAVVPLRDGAAVMLSGEF